MAEELSYAVYQDRQLAEIQAEQLIKRSKGIHYGGKFRLEQNQWQPEAYSGYAVLSMLEDQSGNHTLCDQLCRWQNTLIEATGLFHKLYPLPSKSFHQTIANTLSAERYVEHIVDAGLRSAYPQLIAEAMAQIDPASVAEPIAMRLIGLSLFGSAIGMLGVFEKEQDYQRILAFRRQLYHNPALQAIGIQRTRPFIGHITLLYFGADILTSDGEKIAKACSTINDQIKGEAWYFYVNQTQLMQYPHLAQFDRELDYPTYSFVRP
jgi:hypothetical protein